MNTTPQERYQYKPFPGSSHLWAKEQISPFDSDTTVLDIGPGSGILGQMLSEQGVTELYAVEPDEDARRHAQTIYKEVSEDLSRWKEKKFDLILLLDVLEHMTHPEAFFAEVSTLLQPGGTILISVPNIAHWSVRFPLLFGHFQYTERGLLDKTHYQFFTRKRLTQMIAGTPDIFLREGGSTIEPIQFLLPEALWNNPLFDLISKGRLLLARLLPGLFAYQHLALVRANNRQNSG